MAGIFERLGYSFPQATETDVPELPQETIVRLKMMPKYLQDWQVDDLANTQVDTSNTSTYYVNPVANVTGNLITICETIKTTSGATGDLQGVVVAANTVAQNVALSYLDHTDRMSRVKDAPETANANTDIMTYEKAISVATFIGTIMYQTDGITNTAPTMGHFTSLYIDDELLDKYNTLVTHQNTIASANLMYANIGGIWYSNLESNTVNTIVADIQSVSSLMDERRNHDENFYYNSVQLTNEIQTMRKLNTVGQSERQVIRKTGRAGLLEKYL
jgi:hypothetical protein